MTTGPIVKWDAPNRAALNVYLPERTICLVQAALRADATKGIKPDGFGALPHVVAVPDIAPIGTGPSMQVDWLGRVLKVLDDRPRALRIDTPFFETQNVEFTFDLDQEVRLPWPARLYIEGGATDAVGGTTPCDVRTIITSLQYEAEIDPVEDFGGWKVKRFKVIPYGSPPMSPPTRTYCNIKNGGPATPIPRGARSIIVPTTTAITIRNFDPGDGSGVAQNVTLSGGCPMPIGPFAGGNFNANGSDIPLLAFEMAWV